jgi:hypothetical protein
MRKRPAVLASSLVVLALAWLFLPQSLLGQAAGGSLVGRVTDEQGGARPGATVTAVATATGLSRSVVSGPDGSYTFATLPAGSYDVSVELAGFQRSERKDVVVNVATDRTLDFQLNVAGAAETVAVTSEAPLVRSESSIGAVVSTRELENLPVNGRQFANLAILAPGTSLAYNSDPTKPGQLTVALNGGIGRNVNYLIDGGDNTDDTIGGALQNFSLESVQEFNIQTQQYKAEYGRSTGGILAVVTKTGTNDFHGSVFGFVRDDALNSKTESEKRAGIDAQPYERYGYGASLGGPIARDRVHFFATYERTDRETAYTVDTGGLIPSEDGRSTALPFEDTLVGAKVTANISAKQFLQVRFGYQKNSDKYGANPLVAPDFLGTVNNKYSTILAGHTAQIGSTALNEFLFQYSKFDNTISPDSKNPTLYYPSGVFSGQNINTPQSTHQEKYQFKDDFSFAADIAGQRHDFKVGVQYIHEPSLGGDFSVGVDAPLFSLKEDRIGSPVTDITRFGGFAGFETPVEQYSAYVQDDWRPNNRLTVNVGLRYDFWDGFDLDQRSNPIWQTLSTQTTYNEYYLRDFQGGKGGVLENDDDNFGPRIGFSWDVTGKAKTFVRGGWGIYYDFPYTNATILFPSVAVQSNYGVVYNYNNSAGIRNADGSFFQPGQPLPPNQLTNPDISPPNEVASPTLATPYSRQASIGISTELADWLGISVDLVSIDYRDIPFRFRANPLTGVGEPRRFPQFANFRLWYGNGEADYDGVNLGIRARVSQKVALQGFYTYSEADGNVLAGADEFRLTDVGYQPDLSIGRDVSVNPLDPLCNACFGPLNTDARHRVTLGGTWLAPWGLTVAGMFRYRSATPYTVISASDLNGDGFLIDLPPDVDHVNSERGDSFSQLDLRLSKEFKFTDTLGLEVIGEVFNVFDSENPAGFVGNRGAGNFGQPTTFAGDPLQGEQRLAQLGLRLRF